MVHLMTALIPKPLLRVPNALLTAAEVQAAQAAFKEHEAVIQIKTPFADSLSALSDPREAPKAKAAFQQAAEQFRYALLGDTIKDPTRRLELHQMVMAANFYNNAVGVGPSVSLGDPRARILDTYNYDMRRDTILKAEVAKSTFAHKTTTPESDAMVGNLLQLERRLFGKSRLAQRAHAGRQALFLGCFGQDIRDEAHLNELLSLPPIKEHGNFVLSFDDADPELKDAHKIRWKDAVLECGEEVGPQGGGLQVIDPAPFSTYKSDDLQFRMRILKPAPFVPFWGRVRANALQLWVLVFGAWAMFFIVDEEIISLIALLYLKYAQTQTLNEELEKAGDESRLYMWRNHNREWTNWRGRPTW